LRFPGQYLDVEDGLHQNGFRDYDPSTGRYVESDPIGLASTKIYAVAIGRLTSEDSNPNLYVYVDNNPTNYVDAYGLYTLKPGVPAPSPAIAALLDCIEAKTGTPLVVTSTSEPAPYHAPVTPHQTGAAVDVKYPVNPDKVLCAAAECGAGFGLDEKKHPSPLARGPHIHLQISARDERWSRRSAQTAMQQLWLSVCGETNESVENRFTTPPISSADPGL
jgi:RHS repeat-associated protein